MANHAGALIHRASALDLRVSCASVDMLSAARQAIFAFAKFQLQALGKILQSS
jgi:hypothetical protein